MLILRSLCLQNVPMTLCILGGGVAGLAAAHYAVQSSVYGRIVLVEAASRLGGWVHTVRHRDGVLYEKGPRTVRPAGAVGANTLALVSDLGLEDRVRPVTYSHPSATNRLVLVDNKLHRLPSSLASLFKTLPPFSRPLALAALRDLAAPRVECEDCSLHDFVSRRLGPELAEFAVSSLVRGICAGDSREVSVHFIARYLHQLEQQCGRITLGVARDWLRGWLRPEVRTAEEEREIVKRARGEHWAVWGLENGLETLVETLRDSVTSQGVEIMTDVEVDALETDGPRLVLSAGGLQSPLTADKVVLAVPAFQAARLVAGVSPQLSSLLAQTPFVDVAVVNMEFRGKVLDHQGFGFLVPQSQPQPLLGCIYDSCTFPQGNRTLLTVMTGGAWYQTMVGDRPAQEVEQEMVEEVRRILNISARPVRAHTSLLPQCIAQYTVGHTGRLRRAREEIQRSRLALALAGSSYDGVGINDTIMSAKHAVIV